MENPKHLHLYSKTTNFAFLRNTMYSTNYFKSTTIILTFVLFLFLSFGCEKEIIEPQFDTPTAQLGGFNQIVRPSNQCAPSGFATMQDGVTSFGNVEILNNGSDLYLLFSLNNYKFLDEVRVYVGDKSVAPLNADGDLETEEFRLQDIIAGGTNRYTMIHKLDRVPDCVDIIVYAKISTRNMFGQVTSTNDTWMHGTTYLNGYSQQYCVVNCLNGGSGGAATY